MASSEKPSKAEILAWALRRLGDGDFNFETDGLDGGWQLCMWSLADGDPPLSKEELRGLDLLAGYVWDESNLSHMADESGITTEQTLNGWLQSPLQPHLGSRLRRLRLELGSKQDAATESLADQIASDAISDAIAAGFLKDLGHTLPKIIQRAELLRVLPTDEPVPAQVQTYLKEASLCFIYGHFIACLAVCRSAIEFAIKDRLKQNGRKQTLPMTQTNWEDSLKNLTELARKTLPWTLKSALDAADDVRIHANKAVHQGVPNSTDCKDIFDKTRGILRELYTKPVRPAI